MKLRSCLALFSVVGPHEPVFEQALALLRRRARHVHDDASQTALVMSTTRGLQGQVPSPDSAAMPSLKEVPRLAADTKARPAHTCTTEDVLGLQYSPRQPLSSSLPSCPSPKRSAARFGCCQAADFGPTLLYIVEWCRFEAPTTCLPLLPGLRLACATPVPRRQAAETTVMRKERQVPSTPPTHL